MKYLIFLILSITFISCSSQDRKISSNENLSEQERTEQLSEFGSGYRN